MGNIAFCLSGGGAAGANQVGALKALFEHGIIPSFIVGTSAGALNAFGVGVCGIAGLEDIWKSIKKESDIFSGQWLWGAFKTGHKNPEPLRKKLAREWALYQGQVKIPFAVTTVSLISGEVRYTEHTDPDIVNMTVASASIPGYVDSYLPETLMWADGGTKENLPLARAIASKPSAVVCLHCHPRDPRNRDSWQPGNPIKNGMRGMSLAMEENYKWDRVVCGELDIPVIDVYPDVGVIDTLDFNEKKIKGAIAYNYGATIRKIAEIKRQLSI